MKKSPWVLFIVSSLVSAAVVVATLAIKLERCVPGPSKPCPEESWLIATVLWLKPHSIAIILVATGIGFIAQVIEKALGGHGFRKAKVEKFLDEVVKAQFKGEARQHRLTLYRKVGGFRAKLIAWWRLGEQEVPDEKRRKRDAVRAIKWGGTYLHVYARASRAPNKKSSAVWRVYRDRGGSEGVAGRAWDEGEVVIVRDLPKILPETLANVAKLAEADAPVREYAEMTNTSNIVHLRAMRHVAQHFMGVVIETASGEPWGVLLVDSMKDECPFPSVAAQEKMFKKQFRDHATMLSLLLS